MFEINKDFCNANISRTIRFTDKIFEELKEVSTNENVSFNMLVLQCCRFALDNMNPEKNKKK